MGTDTYQCEAIANRAETAASDLMLLTPTLWVGNSVNHLGFEAAVYLDPTRYVSVLVDLAKSFIGQGFRHFLFLNGHGANTGPLLTALHQLEADYIRERDDLQIAAAAWWSLGLDVLMDVRESPVGAAGHACEIETSLMLATHGSLVRTDRYVEGAHDHPHPDWASYDFNGSSRVLLVEMFHRGAPDGVAGLPSLATADKGQEMVDRISTRLVEFVRDFSTW
jgi:creatinine amidohydrolase